MTCISLDVYIISPENPWIRAAVINTGSYYPASQQAAVKLVYGEIEANPQPPQDLLTDDRPFEEWEKIRYKSVKRRFIFGRSIS